MKRRLRLAAGAGALMMSLGLAAAGPVAAYVPVELDVSPAYQIADGCPSVVANWSVSFYGGTSGSFTVTVHYGDGNSLTRQLAGGTYAWGHTFYIMYCLHKDWYQSWSASRSGGGTDYASTQVESN
jgi:hypothetical protein